jgi:hypothetical protein
LCQIEPGYTSYICTSYLHNVNENKLALCWVLNRIFKNKIIPLVQKLTQLKEHIISSCLTFVQIYKLYGYGQYRMHGSVINVLIDMNQTQSILLCLPHNDATIGWR